MLDVARSKPGADRVRWLHGDATTMATRLPTLQVDVATMTGNVAQVFLTDDAWDSALRATARAVRPTGHLVFETRDPARRAWERWTPERTRARLDTTLGPVEVWCEITGVDGPFVSFRWTHVFESDGAVVTSDSTLRFRDRGELAVALVAAGFEVVDVGDAPDRPGTELVFVARRSTRPLSRRRWRAGRRTSRAG
jgi:SAM-dependent methyltransferase